METEITIKVTLSELDSLIHSLYSLANTNVSTDTQNYIFSLIDKLKIQVK